MKINKTFGEIIELLDKRPLLLIVTKKKISYFMISSYIQGFFTAIKSQNNIDIERALAKWFNEKMKGGGTKFNFFYEIEEYLDLLDDNDKTNKLLGLLREFNENVDLEIGSQKASIVNK